MKFKIQLSVMDDDNRLLDTDELLLLVKQDDILEDIGLSLEESKSLLKSLQQRMVNAQANSYLEHHRSCSHCGKKNRKKGTKNILFQTLFGDITIESPRYHHCDCHAAKSKSFSPLTGLFTEHIAPERLYLESKWAALCPFEKTVGLLRDALPMDEKLNASSVRNHLAKIAEKEEKELGEERYSLIDGCQRSWGELPIPEGMISVGIDGGYVRNWEDKKRNFEVIAGKSVPMDQDSKFFGFVDTYKGSKPKRRLFETLKSQGLQFNQPIEFFSDGAENLRNLQDMISPESEHYLDWFHITMKITVLRQFTKGISKLDKTVGKEFDTTLERIKWNLWHGKVGRALELTEDLCWEAEEMEVDYANSKKFKRLLSEFFDYIRNNRHYITNYGERHRNDEIVSTSFVESTINKVVAKRFCKKQQMQWTKKGAHQMLLIRTIVLNGDLANCFRKWYPKLKIKERGKLKMAA